MDSPPLLPKVMDLLLDAVCVVDVEGRFVFISAACERIFGYTPEEMIGRNMIEFVFPDDRERTLAAAATIMDGMPHPHFENRYVHKDGRVVDIMWSASWSESDRLRLAVARDITELKRVEHTRNALYRISEAAHTSENVHALCQHIHRIIDELVPADNFTVALCDETDETLAFPYSTDPQATQLLETDTPIAEVIRSGQAVLINHDALAVDWLGVPLLTERGIMGVLAIQSDSGKRRYTEEDKQLLYFVSTQIASAIQRKQAEAELMHRAHHDVLTDLPNRALFNDRFDVALARAHRDGEQLALLYLDLKDFKYVNDSFGHEVGDQVLREMAHRLLQCVRESDTVGRMGGDEFTVLLTNVLGPEYTGIIADRIRAAIAAPFDIAGQRLTISVSIGVAVYPDQGEDREQLFRQADADMYAVKRQ
ncbi:diguanylate cyclase with PAS/PAC and GAF sensors [Thiohalophilus thiocyanatoxydans]|uniref:Diguanylate cyclase with PAS/PAC and GAF sensors n=2 Tax=Thiohalophilus thiocyanatoxydans TaxID=381308 RepID=A0A4R8J2B2_9GAMM|nr:diguanylate cyclase [Thiohalophilus thiocyanatoxydans]TDY04359.1 diguanylate cyclase with PAS/PAC and GAF sensors [Thiohalophilus thiocyanatoxydans]